MKKILSFVLLLCMFSCLCAVCFAEECAHTDTSPSTYYYDCEFIYVDEQYHEIWGYEFSCDRCVVCGMDFNEQQVSDEKVSLMSSHQFTDGVCYCGYESTCPHNSTYESSYFANALYSDITEKTHTVKGYKAVASYCDNCNSRISAEQDEELSTEVQAHSFYNGSCNYCGYTIECEHSSYESYESNMHVGEEYYDESSHISYSYPAVWYYCNDCGSSWEEGDPNNVEENILPHYFENGVCDCGAENSCSHENTQTSRSFDNAKYTAVNALGHVVVGDAVLRNYCTDCHDSWGTDREKAVEMEAHYLDYSSDEYNYYSDNTMMTCVNCGYNMPSSFDEHFDGLYTSYPADTVLEDVKALIKEHKLIEGGADENYVRYGYLPDDKADSVIGNFSIVRPAVAVYEVDNNLFNLGAFAEWEIENQYHFQLDGSYDDTSAPIDLARLRGFFNGEWKNSKALDSAAAYTADRDGSFYAWVPVYYEDGPGSILDNDIYLFLYIVHPGPDSEYLEGKIHYAYEHGLRSESFFIADSDAVASFLSKHYDPGKISQTTEEASEDYYDLSEGCQSKLVKQLQTTLVELGYLTSSADGYYGPDTKEAVKACQKEMGFDVTGVADVEFLEAILSNAGETALISGWLKACGY